MHQKERTPLQYPEFHHASKLIVITEAHMERCHNTETSKHKTWMDKGIFSTRKPHISHCYLIPHTQKESYASKESVRKKDHHPSRREVRFVKISNPKIEKRLLKSVDNGSVSRLLLEVAVEEKRAVALSPGLAVGNTPLGDTDTVLGLDTGVDNLDVAAGISAGKIKLSHGTLGSSSADSLESSRDVVGAVERARLAKVSLGTNTVDGDTGGNPLLDVGDEALGLCVGGRVEVVVVDVELGVRVGGTGGLEGNADVVLTKNLHEDVLAEGAVLVEGLVDNVPGVDLALEVGHDLGDVVLHDVGKGGLIVDVLDPLGKLGVPDKGVATDEVAVLAGEVDEVVTTGEVEVALAALGSIPLHGVLGSKLTKVGLDNGSSLGITQSTLVTTSTEVLLALGLEELVKAVSGLGRAGLVAGRDGSLGRSRAGLNGSSSRSSSGGGGGTGNTLRVPGVGLGTVVASNTGGSASEALATALSVGISSLDVSRASRSQRCRKDDGRESGGRDIHLEEVV